MKPRAIALVGPTTSGKTALGLAVARRVGADIVSMDSRQVYRGMDIGTDKVGAAEREAVAHFGLDVVDPDEPYSAGRFARDVRRWLPEIEARDRVPLLVGGTGFFLRAVLEPIFREPPMERDRVEALRAVLGRLSDVDLDRWIEALDPGRASVARAGGPQRRTRTLEVALLTGRPLSWWHREAPADGPPVPCLVVCLTLDRDELDRRIDARVSRMVERGFLDEVRGLIAAGYAPDAPGMSATGYREVAAALRGEMALDDALDEMRRQTRRYARRQMTWFRNQLPADSLRLDAAASTDELVHRIVAAWHAAAGPFRPSDPGRPS